MSIVDDERKNTEKMISALEKYPQLSKLTSVVRYAISSKKPNNLLRDHLVEIEFAYNVLCRYPYIEILYEEPIDASGRQFTPDFQVKYKNKHYFFQMKTASEIVDYDGEKHKKITTDALRDENSDFVCFNNTDQLNNAMQKAVAFLNGFQLSDNSFVYVVISDINDVYEISMLEEYLYENCQLSPTNSWVDEKQCSFFETDNGKKVNGVIYKLRNNSYHLFLNPAIVNIDSSIEELLEIAKVHIGVDC